MDIANGLHTVFVRSETKRQEINALPLSWLFLPFYLYNSSSLIRTGCNICPFDLLLGRRLTFPSRQPDFWTSSRKLLQGAIAVASNDISSFHSIVNSTLLAGIAVELQKATHGREVRLVRVGGASSPPLHRWALAFGRLYMSCNRFLGKRVERAVLWPGASQLAKGFHCAAGAGAKLYSSSKRNPGRGCWPHGLRPRLLPDHPAQTKGGDASATWGNPGDNQVPSQSSGTSFLATWPSRHLLLPNKPSSPAVLCTSPTLPWPRYRGQPPHLKSFRPPPGPPELLRPPDPAAAARKYFFIPLLLFDLLTSN